MGEILDRVRGLYQEVGWDFEEGEETDSHGKVRTIIRTWREVVGLPVFASEVEEVMWPGKYNTFQLRVISPIPIPIESYRTVSHFITRENFCQTLGHFWLAEGVPLTYCAFLPAVEVPSRIILWHIICRGIYEMQRCLWGLKGILEDGMDDLKASMFMDTVGPAVKELQAHEALVKPRAEGIVQQLAAWLKANNLPGKINRTPGGDYELEFFYKTQELTFRCTISEEAEIHRPSYATGRFLSFFTRLAGRLDSDPLVPPPARKVAALEFLNLAHERMRYGVFRIWWHRPTVAPSYVTHSLKYPLPESPTTDRLVDLFLVYWKEFNAYLKGYLAVVQHGADPEAGIECVHQALTADSESDA